jgi:hypothetical protein
MSLAVGSAEAVDAAAGAGVSLRAYADPDTGELVPAPAIDAGGGAAAATATDPTDLELVPIPGAAAGMMIDLRGHFFYATRARVAAAGVVSQQCAPTSAADGEK